MPPDPATRVIPLRTTQRNITVAESDPMDFAAECKAMNGKLIVGKRARQRHRQHIRHGGTHNKN